MKRLLVVGWDAADWKVIDPLLAKDEMPHLAGLLSRGVRGNIATIYPPLSPMLWTSIATGKRAHKHGIHGFIEPTEDGMSVRPISNLSRKTKTFWNILNQHGKRSIVVGWWPSHPAEPIRGAMVSDHFPPKAHDHPSKPMLPGTIWPASLAAEMADLRVHPSEITGQILHLFAPDFPKVDQEKDKSLHDLAGIIAETMSIHNAATDLIERQEWDLAAVYYSGIDHFSHRFMRYHANKVRAKEEQTDPQVFAAIVANAYRYHDVMLGRLLTLAGPDCAVLLLSDHGFHSDRLLPDYIPAEAAGPAVEHRHLGIFCLSAPGTPAGGQVYGASVLDIAPTVLHLFGLPAGADMDGKVLTNAFENQTERERIPSWDDVPGDGGRHPPSRQYDSVAAAESLKQLVDLGYIAPLGDDAAANVAAAVTENRYNLARACLDAGRADLGSEILTELVKENPDQGRFHLHLIHCRFRQRQFAECAILLDAFDAACADFSARAIEELKRRRAERPDEDLKGERESPDRKERRERQELTEKAVGFPLDRLMMRVQLLLADPGREKGEAKSAARAMLEQLAAAPNRRLELAIFLAESFSRLGDHEKALECLHELLEADPENWQALGMQARILYTAGRYSHAAERAIESLSLVYFQPQLHHVLGVCLRRLKQDEAAERELRVAMAQMPRLWRAHLALGRLLQRDPRRIAEASLHTAKGNLLREEAKRRRDKSRPAPVEPVELQQVTDARGPAIFGSPAAPPLADRSRVVTIVSGLPRSGTSMMMQMLAAGGIAAYTDERRAPDADNPRGYFEHEQATRVHQNKEWLPEARGKAVKIVAHLLPHLPAGEQYRIVFMHRHLDEVTASQRAMLQRLGRSGGKLEGKQLALAYSRQLVRVEGWLRRASGVHVLGIQYAQAITDPKETAAKLAAFLGEPFDQLNASGAADPSLRRQTAD